MSAPNYNKTRFACYYAYLAMASIFVLPSMLFTTFHQLYGISFTLLGTLIVFNFCTQMIIDLIFTFFPKYFNIRLTVRLMPLLTALGLLIYAIVPNVFPDYAYLGLVFGTIIFSVAAGLCEVLLSPLVAALPSEHPEKDMSLLHSLYGFGVVGAVLISSLYFFLFGTAQWIYLAIFWASLPLVGSILFWISPIPEMNLSAAEKGKKNNSHRTILLLCALCIFLGSSAENTMTNWISSYMELGLQIPKELGDILGLAVFAVLLALTRVFYAKYSPNITKTLLVSMIGAVACYWVAGLSGWIIPAFAACIFTGVCTSMLWPGTLILMEEKLPSPGVAAYALMAACGDCGASVAPQLMGILVDNVSVSNFAAHMSQSTGMTEKEIGLKVGMLVASLFPIAGVCVVLYIKRYFAKKKS